MEDVVIVAGVRTPVGKFQGALSNFSAVQLGSLVVREALSRARLNPDQVDECIMGNVVSAGLGQNPARQAAIHGGLSPSVSAMTVNKVCGSGLKAVGLAVQAIQTGNAEIVIAGGMESMTNAPYLLPQGRSGFRMGNATVVDSMIHDGLWEIYNDYHMGITGEHVAEKHGITREEQDQYALNSHRKAAAAWRACYLRSQILPIEIPAKKKGEAATIVRPRRIGARGRHARGAARAEARFQERRNRHRRQCARRKRWRCRSGGDVRGESCIAGACADGPHPRPGHQRHRS